MALLDTLFFRKSASKAAAAERAGAGSVPPEEDQAQERKSQRLERRELLYAVVRECMARVGVLSSSYKYKVLSLDSRGNQYLIMMDLPQEMAEHIGQLAEIEQVVTETARTRHRIEVRAVYWRIHELAHTSVLRKPRGESELAAARAAPAPDDGGPIIDGAAVPGRPRRFEPIRADEVQAFKQALARGGRTAPTDFEPTQLSEEGVERLPLSRTQYGDLI